MSYKPHWFGFFCPTGWVLPPVFLAYQAYCSSSASASPKQKAPGFPARQAYSHSASVGKRQPAHWQKAWASSHETPTTGCWGSLNWRLLQYSEGLMLELASWNRWYSRLVTGYLPSRKGFEMRTRWTGRSSSYSLLAAPISNSPAGMLTNAMPV